MKSLTETTLRKLSVFTALIWVLTFCTLPEALTQHVGVKIHQQMSKDRSLDNSLYMLHIWNEWNADMDRSTQIAKAAYDVFSAHENKSYQDLAADEKFAEIIQKYDVSLLGGPLLGKIREDGAGVWVRTVTSAEVDVLVSDGKKSYVFGPVRTDKSSDLSAIIDIYGLKPGHEYTYAVRVNGIQEGAPGIIKTLPVKDEVRIAFGTCFHRWGLGNLNQARQIIARRPHAMLLGGDIAVQDRLNHLGMHRFDYLMRDLFPAWQMLAGQIPMYATWDDHDYFDDDLSGIPEGYNDDDRRGVREVFLQSWNNPSYGLEDSGEGVFFRTRIGPADVIMLDNRYFRDKEKGWFLGPEQMDWLETQLLDCKGPFIILSCGTMWSDYVSNGKDSWGVWDPEGREKVFQLIEKNKIGGVLLISGDRHGARGFTIPRSGGFSLYEFEPASLGGRHGPPAKNDAWDTQLFGFDNQYAFGEFSFNTKLVDPEVTFRLIGDEGELLYEINLKKSTLTPP